MPSISSLSYNQGAETGSQFLDIAGTGFDQNAGQTQVLIGGQECSIVDGAITSTNIQCQTPAKSSDADPGYWMGSAGLKYELWQNNLDFDPGTLNTWDDIKGVHADSGPAEFTTILEQGPIVNEAVNGETSGFTARLTGFFNAPYSGDFKFYAVSSDKIAVFFSKTGAPEDAERIIKRTNSNTDVRGTGSDDITLVKGQTYYFAAIHRHDSGTTAGNKLRISLSSKETRLTNDQTYYSDAENQIITLKENKRDEKQSFTVSGDITSQFYFTMQGHKSLVTFDLEAGQQPESESPWTPENFMKMLEARCIYNNDPDFDENMTFEDFYAAINTNEKEYLELLGISERGKVLVLKRNCKERFINNYNSEMLTAWNANMDIQLVVDPYAVISYIASYMNKTDTQTTPFLREALTANAGKTTKEKLKALKEAYLTHRQVGASEAAYKVISSLRLKDSNISCIFVVTGFPQNRSRFFRKVKDDQEEFEEYENEQDDADSESDDDMEQVKPPVLNKCKIEGREGTFQESTTVMDRYITRPRHLDEMCLAQFAISYIPASKVPKRIIFDDDGCSNEWSDQEIFHEPKKLPRYISMEKSGYGKMRLRAFPAVMRIHSSKKKEGHEQHYAELQLYTPWRDEKNLFANDVRKCIEKFQQIIEDIKANKKMIFPGEETIDLIENLDLELHKPMHIFDLLDSQREQEREEDLAFGVLDDPEFESFGYTGNLGKAHDGNFESSKYRIIKMPSNDEMDHFTRRLVPEQLNILRRVDSYCMDVLKSEEILSHVVEPLKMIVHGGAGKK